MKYLTVYVPTIPGATKHVKPAVGRRHALLHAVLPPTSRRLVRQQNHCLRQTFQKNHVNRMRL